MMNQAEKIPTLIDVAPDNDRLATEDSIVAELERLDIRYLARGQRCKRCGCAHPPCCWPT